MRLSKTFESPIALRSVQQSLHFVYIKKWSSYLAQKVLDHSIVYGCRSTLEWFVDS